jgi:SulP family sulfate permease
MVGFLNSMAVIIILSQLMFFKDPADFAQGLSRPFNEGYHMNTFAPLMVGSWVSASTGIVMATEAVLTFAISLGLPRITKTIPGVLVALIVITGLEWGIRKIFPYSGSVVGDIATIETPNWPVPFFFSDSIDLPALNMNTFLKIWPTGLSVFFISQMESLLVLKHIRSMNQADEADVSTVALSQGLGQFFASFCGGMAGSTSITQSVILRECGGASNFATFVAAAFLCGIGAGGYVAFTVVPLGFIVGVNVFAVSQILFCLFILHP